MESHSLTGRRAIVTGASRGLGREIARAFLAAGADVALCARSAADIEAAAHALGAEYRQRRIVAHACDLARPEDIDAFYAATLNAFGAFDVVVNNAGICGPIGPLDEVEWREWLDAVAVNLLGTAYSCRRAVSHFKSAPRRTRAKIVNLSGGGATAPQPRLSAYGASKAGLVRLTETLAAEVRDCGIDVNAVAPGALATRMTDELLAAGPARIGAGLHRRLLDLTKEGDAALKRAAALCVYLASTASDGLTGRLISAPWDPWPFADDAKRAIGASDLYTLRRVGPARDTAGDR